MTTTLNRIFMSLVAAIVMSAAAAPADAQAQLAPPPQTPYGMPISLEDAKKVAAAAVVEANRISTPMTMAIVDTGGYLLYFERMANNQLASVQLAIDKARTAAFTGVQPSCFRMPSPPAARTSAFSPSRVSSPRTAGCRSLSTARSWARLACPAAPRRRTGRWRTLPRGSRRPLDEHDGGTLISWARPSANEKTAAGSKILVRLSNIISVIRFDRPMRCLYTPLKAEVNGSAPSDARVRALGTGCLSWKEQENSSMRRKHIALGLVGLAVLVIGQLRAQGPAVPADQWPNYHHNSNFSPLTQITPANVSRLAKAWTFNYGVGDTPTVPSVGLDDRFQVQPLHIGGVLYISTPGSARHPDLPSTVTALEPETGKVVWQYKAPRNIHGRGLAYWKGNGTIGPRLFFATSKGFLMALDLKTGTPAAGFGSNGEVDAYVGIVSPEVGESRRDTYTIPNPVTIYKNLIITGARPGEDLPPQPRGDVRAWDAVTGKLVWSFHTVPLPGEPNHEDWPGETWKNRSGCNVYSNLTADESTGLVFGATGEANKAIAPGKNLYCNSILALEAETGKLKWFQQLIHRDANNWDMPGSPVLVRVRKDGRTIPAVLQTGKTRFTYIFDRVSGEPIFGLEERPVMGATGDVYPTQPVPLKPPPSGPMSVTRADLNKMTPEIEKFCAEAWDTKKLQDGAPYGRSSAERPIVQIGGSLGNWGPLAYDESLGYVFHNVTHATGGADFVQAPEWRHGPVHRSALGIAGRGRREQRGDRVEGTARYESGARRTG